MTITKDYEGLQIINDEYYKLDDDIDTEAEAIEAWNKRICVDLIAGQSAPF